MTAEPRQFSSMLKQSVQSVRSNRLALGREFPYPSLVRKTTFMVNRSASMIERLQLNRRLDPRREERAEIQCEEHGLQGNSTGTFFTFPVLIQTYSLDRSNRRSDIVLLRRERRHSKVFRGRLQWMVLMVADFL